MPDLAAAERFGIDTTDPYANERAALAAYLLEEGIPLEELRQTQNLHELTMLAWRRIYDLEAERVPLDEVARRADVDVDLLERAYRALGLPNPGEGGIDVNERDIETLRFLGEMGRLLGTDEVIGLCRVIGSSLARIAEAVVASIRVNYEVPVVEEAGYVDFVRLTEAIVNDGLPRLVQTMDRILRYHMLRMSDQPWNVTPERSAMTTELAVGFADMVGFTERSN